MAQLVDVRGFSFVQLLETSELMDVENSITLFSSLIVLKIHLIF